MAATSVSARFQELFPETNLISLLTRYGGLITHPENDDIDWTTDEFVSDWNDLHRGEEPLK